MCECITDINQKLAPQNARLSLTITFMGPGLSEYPHIAIEKIDRSKRGKIPTCFIPTFCPFCGEKYTQETEAGGA